MPFWPPTRFVEFLAGVAICRFGIRIPQVIGLGLALAFLTGYSPAIRPSGNLVVDQFVWQAQNIVYGGALISSLTKDGWLSRAVAIPPLIIGGEISYSMYMTHQVVNFGLLDRITGLGAPAALLVTTMITISLSLLLFYFIETPARTFVKRWLRRPGHAQQRIERDGIAQPQPVYADQIRGT